jgi:hypothetical protein
MTGVLTKEQFEKEWREREKLAVVPATPRVRVRVRGVTVQQIEPGGVVRTLARPLLAAAIAALLDFDEVTYTKPQKPRRIQRK